MRICLLTLLPFSFSTFRILLSFLGSIYAFFRSQSYAYIPSSIEQYKHQAPSYPYQAYRPSTSRTHTFEDGSDSDSDSDEDEDDDYIETSFSAHESSFDSSMTLSTPPSSCNDHDLSNIDPRLLEEDRDRVALSGGVSLGLPSSLTRSEMNEDEDEDGEFEIEDDLTLWSDPDSVPATPSSRGSSIPRSYTSSKESTHTSYLAPPAQEENGEGFAIKEGVTTILLS